MEAVIANALQRMIAVSKGDQHDIAHFLQVYTYATLIGTREALTAEEQRILEAAALTHDIACPLCREKYGKADGTHQEAEGAPMARTLLLQSGMTESEAEEAAALVGCHHTLSPVRNAMHQILLEADWLVNAGENGWGEEAARKAKESLFVTACGKALLHDLFLA